MSAGRRLALVGLVAFGIALAGLPVPLMFDDMDHLMAIEAWWDPAASVPAAYAAWRDPLGLLSTFRFHDGHDPVYRALVGSAQWPWWTSPDLRLDFWRPLSSLAEAIEYLAWGRWAPGWRLGAAVKYAGLCVLVAALYRRVLPRGAWVAALLFAVDDAHFVPVAWMAQGNSVLSVGLAVAAFALDVSTRGSWPSRLGVALLVLLGLLAGETALCVLAFHGSWVVLRAPRETRRASLLALGAPTLLWLVAYVGMDMGADGSGFYLHPVNQPLAWGLALPGRLLALLGSGLGPLPAELTWLPGRAPVLPVVQGLALLGLAGWAWGRVRDDLGQEERRTWGWLALGTVLACLPLASALPHNRLLLGPTIGVAALLGAWIPLAWAQGGAARWLAGGAVLIHGVLAPLVWVGTGLALHETGRRTELALASPDLVAAAGAPMLVPVCSDSLVGLFPPNTLHFEGRRVPEPWLLLTSTPRDVVVTPLDEDSLQLDVVDGAALATPLENLVRAGPPSLGETVEHGAGATEVLAVDEAGYPTSLRFDLEYPLAEWHILEWTGEGFERVRLDGPTHFKWRRGPSGL